jgi:glyoxylase-like metal-dependent hydrolase (beta-lactamase superfamily II)
MNADYYHFKLGAFKCTSLSDGSNDYPPQNIFANVPKDELEAVLRRHNLPTDHVTTPYTYLVVDTGEQRVLVDMGAGHLAPSTGKLVPSMKAAGIEPASIDVVMITHAHPDHIGGALDDEGKPVYANARYFIWKGEWDFWFSGEATVKWGKFAELARKTLQPLQDKTTLVTQESQVLPGIGVITAPGHTPGHVVVSFSSRGQQLMYIGDTVISPLHLEYPDWLPVYDIQPEQAAASKRRIFDLAAAEGAWVIGQHFPPFPSLGHVVKQGEGWLWQPVQEARA